MKYFYEYKEVNGATFGGHNLENVITKENIIILKGVDIISTNYGENHHYWTQTIDMNEIEYLKIFPMKEDEE